MDNTKMGGNMDEYLEHFGVPGMKWGRRKARATSSSKPPTRRQEKKAELKSYRKDKGPKRFGVLNAANSAARTMYRAERTGNFKTYRNAQTKLRYKEARLTDDQIKNGRYRVARFRSVRANVATAAAVAALGGASVATGLAVAAPAIAGLGGVAVSRASGRRFYAKERRAYGGTRAKYQTQKRVKAQRK